MKYLSLIIGLLIATLSFIPCGDTSCNKIESHKIVDNHAEDSDSDKHHADHCSPLCVCSCCSTVTAQIEFKWYNSIPLIDNKMIEEIEFQLPIVSKIYYSIWEPPQLV